MLIHTLAHTHTHTHTHTHLYIYTHTSIYIYTHTHIHTYIHTHIRGHDRRNNTEIRKVRQSRQRSEDPAQLQCVMASTMKILRRFRLGLAQFDLEIPRFFFLQTNWSQGFEFKRKKSQCHIHVLNKAIVSKDI